MFNFYSKLSLSKFRGKWSKADTLNLKFEPMYIFLPVDKIMRPLL